MAYGRKGHLVEALTPDVVVLQEVSKADIIGAQTPFGAWAGSNKHKGLGVLGMTPANYTMTEQASSALPWHLPFSVNGLNMIALWAHKLTQDQRYVRITHQIADTHSQYLGSGRGLILGDFNSNTVWDRGHPGRNHSMLVDKLEKLGLDSVFHRQEGCPQGEENIKTYFHRKNADHGHHIDYAFLSMTMDASIRVGEPTEWLKHSDHMPLILDIHQLPGSASSARGSRPTE